VAAGVVVGWTGNLSLPPGIIVKILDFLRPSSEEVRNVADASYKLEDKVATEWGGG
jgi:hypothetical protein